MRALGVNLGGFVQGRYNAVINSRLLTTNWWISPRPVRRGTN